MIHPSSIIDPTAIIADSVEIGPFCLIGPDVEIGANCTIDRGTAENTIIG